MYLRGVVLVALLILSQEFASAQRSTLPNQVDLGPRFEKLGLPTRVQGGRNTCSLFAITALAELEFSRGQPRAFVPLSEEFLVWAANEATGRSGDQAMFYEVVLGLNTLGVCSADLQSYQQSGESLRPSPQAMEDAKLRRGCWKVHWIRRWDLSRPLSDEDFLAIKSALAAGHPVACGLRWPKDGQGGAILRTPPPGEVYDGHSIAITGYQDHPRRQGVGVFSFRNSFGAAWGKKGYGVMSYDYTRAYANDALWLEYDATAARTPSERIEAESMEVVLQDKCEARPQLMHDFGSGMWSDGKHLLCRAEKGGRIDLAFAVKKAGRYRLDLLGTAAPDFGVLRVAVNGKFCESTFDLYSGRVSPSGALGLGELTLTAGKHRLQLLVDRKHQSSKGYFFGLDVLELYEAP